MEGGGAGRREEKTAYFFPPLPSPSPILNPSTSPLKSLFDSSQLSGSINVQDGGTTSFLKTVFDRAPKYACFAGYEIPARSTFHVPRERAVLDLIALRKHDTAIFF